MSNWKVCLLNAYAWGCHLKTKAISTVYFSYRQKTSKWHLECILRYPF